MAGLLRAQEHSLASRELFRQRCVGICGRPSNGQILLDHYRHKRRRFAGDERVCHQSVTAMRWPTARPKAPADDALASSCQGRCPGASRPVPTRTCCESRTMRWRGSARAQVCRRAIFPSAQRRANKRRSTASARALVGGHAHRFDWLTQLRAAGCWHRLFAPSANLLRAGQVRLTINSPNDDGTTNSAAARARLKPLKTLA